MYTTAGWPRWPLLLLIYKIIFVDSLEYPLLARLGLLASILCTCAAHRDERSRKLCLVRLAYYMAWLEFSLCVRLVSGKAVDCVDATYPRARCDIISAAQASPRPAGLPLRVRVLDRRCFPAYSFATEI